MDVNIDNLMGLRYHIIVSILLCTERVHTWAWQVGGHDALQGDIMQGGFGGEMRYGEDGCAIFLNPTMFIPMLTQYKVTFCILCRKTILDNFAVTLAHIS